MFFVSCFGIDSEKLSDKSIKFLNQSSYIIRLFAKINQVIFD